MPAPRPAFRTRQWPGDCQSSTCPAPCPPCARGLCSAASPGHLSVRAGGGTLPPRSVSADHRPSWGVRPRARSAPWRAAHPGLRTCALGRSPYPNPGSRAHSRARMGLFPLSIPRHLAEPALRASSSFHLFPQEGGGSGWSPQPCPAACWSWAELTQPCHGAMLSPAGRAVKCSPGQPHGAGWRRRAPSRPGAHPTTTPSHSETWTAWGDMSGSA